MIQFEKAKSPDTVLHWLSLPHVKEYWGDAGITPDDIVKFTNGEESIFTHWLALSGDVPYAYICTSSLKDVEPYDQWSKGKTKSFDFLIGDKEYLGKGLAAPTIKAFLAEQKQECDSFITDPEERNLRAIHVYEKAGFQKITSFKPNSGPFPDKPHWIMRFSFQR